MVHFTAQNAGANGMECAEHQPLRKLGSDQIFNAFLHFTSGFIGKGHCQDLIGAYALLTDQIGDALCQDARLARARAGENQNGARASGDRFFLLGVKRVERIHRFII